MSAQPAFSVADLPTTPGAWHRAYVNTSGVDVTAWLNQKGGPHRWDFTAPPSADERVERMDVVAASDGGHASRFPGATYAERISRDHSPIRSWSFYSIAAGRGRLYHGYHDALSNPSDPAAVFDEPTLELPDTEFGAAWSRTVNFEDVLDVGFAQVPILVRFTAQASVDAWGTVVLPGLGEFPALRLVELQTYVSTDTALGLPLGTHYVRTCAWLVRGIGKAVVVVSKASPSVPPENIGPAAHLRRVFERSPDAVTTRLEPVDQLHATRKGDELFLAWNAHARASRYVLVAAPSLDPGADWTPVVTNRETFFFAPLSREVGQRFYKALAIVESGVER